MWTAEGRGTGASVDWAARVRLDWFPCILVACLVYITPDRTLILWAHCNTAEQLASQAELIVMVKNRRRGLQRPEPKMNGVQTEKRNQSRTAHATPLHKPDVVQLAIIQG
jgi:hypothetical protein